MGSLCKTWVERTDDVTDMEELAGKFEHFFGGRWQDVMVGGERPLAYHLNWEAFLAVAGLTGCAGPALSALVEASRGQEIVTYKVLLG